MDMNNVNIEEIVKQVLSGMTGNAPAAQAAPAATAAPTADPVIPKTAHVAMLTALEHYEIKEFPMPEVGDDDILVKNGPSYSALGFGGEGYCTFTIASRTGEGLTSASTFTKRRRCVMTDSLCIR